MVKSHRKKMKTSHASHDTHKAKPHSAHKPAKKDNSNLFVWQGTVLILGVLLVLAVFTNGFTNIIPEGRNRTADLVDQVDEPLEVELYIMSQCPYGVQAENTIFEAIQDIGEENFDLTVAHIVTPAGDGTFQSLHGQPEVDGNIVQLCAESVDSTKYLDFVLCMNAQAQLIPDNWETCASDLDYDVEAVRTCFEGQEGIDLLTASAALSQEAGASGSPTIYVDNKPYNDGRATLDFKRAFCLAFGDEQPSTCGDIPAPVEVSMTVITGQACASCDTSQIITASEGLFPGVIIEEVEVTSKDGEKLVDKYDLAIIPAYIFDEKVTETQSWAQPQFDLNFDELSDGSYKLKDEVTGASYYIDDEKRDEQFSKMGITLGDNKPEIDFFVMSYCPYGNIGEEIIEEVYNALGDSAEFKPHYIYYENYQGGGETFCMDEDSLYCSMHGATEAKQNVREQCVEEQYGLGAWFKFAREMNAKCTAQNADTCFEDVASDLSYDVDAIKSCEAENALTFAAKDAELMKLFGAQGSPAIYIDGQTYNGGRDANSILAAVCAAFDDAPAECDGKIVTEVDTAVPAGSCG